MLEQDFKYYLDNQSELVKKYNGKFLVIKDCQIIDSFDSKVDAYHFGISKYEAGTFLIQRCSEGQTDIAQTFHSRVSFA